MKLKLFTIFVLSLVLIQTSRAQKTVLTYNLGHYSSIHAISASSNGKYIVSGGGDEIILWNMHTGQKIKSFHESGIITSVLFSPDNKYIISANQNSYIIKIRNIETGESDIFLSSKGHSSYITSLAYSLDSKYIISGSNDGTIKLWNLRGGLLKTFRGHTRRVNSVSFSPDGNYIISGSADGTIKLWDVQTGEEIRTLTGYKGRISSVSFSPNGKYIVSLGDVRRYSSKHRDKI